MNYFYCSILLLIPLTFAYPRSHPNDFDHFLNKYLQGRPRNMYGINNANSNEEHVVHRQSMFPILPIQQQQMQQMCLPNVWTCGPNLPPCCPGLMCYDGNAKRGRHCVARG
jgi:hypothetical protein